MGGGSSITSPLGRPLPCPRAARRRLEFAEDFAGIVGGEIVSSSPAADLLEPFCGSHLKMWVARSKRRDWPSVHVEVKRQVTGTCLSPQLFFSFFALFAT